MRRKLTKLTLAFLILFLSAANGFSAKSDKSAFPGLNPIEESLAFQQYLERAVSEESKLIFLIDRFGESDFQIVYEGHYFNAPFAARVARWFMARRYREQSAREWIMTWCNSSVPAGNLIWVKLSNGKFKLSREILLVELKVLETAAAKNMPAIKKSNVINSSSASLIPGELTKSSLPPIVVQTPTS
jgi:hypothetical protein